MSVLPVMPVGLQAGYLCKCKKNRLNGKNFAP